MAARVSRSSLYHYVRSGDVNIVRELVENHFGQCNVNCIDSIGRTALHYACGAGNLGMVEMLISEFKADVAIQDSDSVTALMSAARAGHDHVVHALLSQYQCLLETKDKNGHTALHHACAGGHVGLVRKLISRFNADLKSGKDTPVHVAASSGKKGVVLVLINQFYCNASVKGKFGRSLLHSACVGGDVSFVKYLIFNHKADPNACDDNNDTVLHAAAQHGKAEVVLCLLKEFGCDASTRGNLKRSLLHSACIGENISLVRTLVREFKADIGVKDENNDTPLHVAIYHGKKAVAFDLVKNFGCSVDDRDEQGRPMVHLAALRGNAEIVRVLLYEFKCNANIRCHARRTLLHQACLSGNADLVMYLVHEHGANVLAKDKDGKTPFHLAGLHGKVEVIAALINFLGRDLGESVFRVACSENDVNLAKSIMHVSVGNDEFKCKLFHLAASCGKIKLVVALMNAFNYTVDRKGYLGHSLLHSACSGGNVGLVRTLVHKYNADITAHNDEKDTPLHVAALHSQEGVVLTLIEMFPHIVTCQKGGSGRSLLHSACMGGNVELVKALILEHKADICARDDKNASILSVAGPDVVCALMTMFCGEVGGHSKLYKACSEGNVTLLTTLVEDYNVNVNLFDYENNTPLHVAALYGREEVVRVLINDYNCDASVKGHLGRSLLHSACAGGNVCLVKRVIQEHGGIASSTDDEKNTPLHVAARCGEGKAALALIREFGCEVDGRGHLGQTLLHSACRGGNWGLAKSLLDEFSADITARDDENNTPLHVAALHGQKRVVLALIKRFPKIINEKGSQGRSLLHSACIGGDIKLVNSLVFKHNLDINARDDNDDTPLHAAALKGKDKVVLTCIESFNNIATKGGLDRSLLHCACIGGSIVLVEALISDYKANVSATDANNATPLHVAVSHGMKGVAFALIRRFGRIDDRDDHGQSVLHRVCSEGGFTLVKTLIEEYSADINIQDCKGNTPLHVAALNGHKEIVCGLIQELGCDPHTKGHLGRSLLHSACVGGNVHLVGYVLKEFGGNVCTTDDGNNTPLHVAVLNGQDQVAGFLLELRCDSRIKGNLNRSLLHNACIGGSVGLVKRLIEEYNADVTARDDENNTPLHVAALHGRENVVLALIEDRNCDIMLQGNNGWSLLHSACIGGNFGLIKTLVNRYKANFDARDNNNDTPLHVVALRGKEDVVLGLIQEVGCDVSVRGNNGHTLLHSACIGGNISLVRILVSKHKADLNATDANSNTALHVAALNGKDKIVLCLVDDLGCDLNVKGHFKRSLLHSACKGGNVELVKTLLNKRNTKHYISSRDSQGNTPIHVAALQGNKDMVIELIRIFKSCLTSKGASGQSLLHSACIGGNVALVNVLVVKHMADCTARDDHNNTPLHVAALSGQHDVAFVLMNEFSCDINHRGHLNRSLLHSACIGGNVSLVRTLAKMCGTDLRDDNNDTPIHVAALSGKDSVVMALINEFDCDVNVKGGLKPVTKNKIRQFRRKIWYNKQNHLCFEGQNNILPGPIDCSVEKSITGWSLLHYASIGGSIGLVETLVHKYNFDVHSLDDEEHSPIHLAALSGNEELVRVLISEFRCEINSRCLARRTLLHHACQGGNVGLVKYMIHELGANILAKDGGTKTPLHLAALHGQKKLVMEFFSEIPNPLAESLFHSACSEDNISLIRSLISIDRAYLNAKDDSGNTPLHSAALHGREEVVSLLVHDFGCDPNVKGAFDRTLLHSACIGGNSDLVKTHLSMHQANINVQDAEGNTPLHLAALYGNEDVASVLVETNLCSSKINRLEYSVLQCACAGGSASLVQKFSRITGIFSPMLFRSYPLHFFCKMVYASTNNEVVVTLMKELSDFLEKPPFHSTTFFSTLDKVLLNKEVEIILQTEVTFNSLDHAALDCLCTGSNLDRVKDLIHKLQVKVSTLSNSLAKAALCSKKETVLTYVKELNYGVNTKGHLGRTLLHFACMGGSAELAEALVSLHKGNLHVKDDQGNTPLHLAAICCKKEVVLTLLSSECSADVVGITGSFNQSLLHSACIGGDVGLVRSLISEYRANVNAKDDKNNAPIHVAAFNGKKDVVLALSSDFGCSVNCRGELGQTVVHIACYTDFLSSVDFFVLQVKVNVSNVDFIKELILQHKADVNAQDDNNDTPLHVAAYHGKEKIVLALINDFHCDLTLSGNLGKSFLHSACANNKANVLIAISNCTQISIPLHDLDDHGDTPLHIAAANGSLECVKVLLLDLNVILMIRNHSSKTPIDIAKGSAKPFLVDYMNRNRDKIYADYDELRKRAMKKCSTAEQNITRVFVVGNPAAGKSSLIEAFKREGFLAYLWRVSEKSVSRHTAGIVPSIHKSEVYGRLQFYDFAGDKEYYSSHAAILENLVSKKGTNIVMIVIDLREDEKKIKDIFYFWFSFVRYQNFCGRTPQYILVGSHLDLVSSMKDVLEKKKEVFGNIISQSNPASYFMLDCCRPKSNALVQLKEKICSIPSTSRSHELSFEAILLFGMLERDFASVTACTICNIHDHISQTGIQLQENLLESYLEELHEHGLVFVVASKNTENLHIVLSTSNLTNKVHQLLFSKDALQNLEKGFEKVGCHSSVNTGIVPLPVLKEVLPEFITKQCLVQLQYCQEISYKDVDCFPSLIHSPEEPEEDLENSSHNEHEKPSKGEPNTKKPSKKQQATSKLSEEPSFLFFPALCVIPKDEVSWQPNSELSYSIGWLARCTSPLDYFPSRFLHVLLLRLVYKFTLSAERIITTPHPSSFSDRRCTMWKTGVQWLMEEGVECTVELVNGSKAIVVVVNSDKDSVENCVHVFNKIVSCILKAKAEFCHLIALDFYLLGSAEGAEDLREDNLFSMREVEEVLKTPGKKAAVSINGKKFLKKENIVHLYPLTFWYDLFPLDSVQVLTVLEEVSARVYMLGVYLGVPKNRMDIIEQSASMDQRTTGMVRVWMNSSEEPACWWHLVQALKKIKETQLAKKIQTEHGKFTSWYDF